MSRIHVTLHDSHRHLSAFVRSLPRSFCREGRVVHSGRNEVRVVCHEGHCLAVKRFARKGLSHRLINAFRRSKAQKAYANACMLESLCLPTPAPVAFVEVADALGLVVDAYYICEYTDMKAIADGLCEDGDFNRPMTAALARFIALLHIKGVFHHDLNSTNVLYRETCGTYAFTLIDINRMTIEPEPELMTTDRCLRNITRFSRCSEMFRFFLEEYLRVRGLPADVYDRAMKIKTEHDSSYARKKKVTGLLKKMIRKHVRQPQL